MKVHYITQLHSKWTVSVVHSNADRILLFIKWQKKYIYLKYWYKLLSEVLSKWNTFLQLCRIKNNDDSLSEVDGAGGDSKMTSSATQTQQDTQNLSALYRGTWPVERSLWHSGPSSIGGTGGSKSITQVLLNCAVSTVHLLYCSPKHYSCFGMSWWLQALCAIRLLWLV